MQAPPPGQELLGGAAFVGGAGIPEQQHGPPQVAQQLVQEADHLGTAQVVRVQLKIQSHVLANRANGQRRDGGEALAAVAVA